MDVVIVNSGIGNIKSIRRMFQAVDGEAQIAQDPSGLAGCKRLVLPGIGHFDEGMSRLHEGGWIEAITHAALERRVPTLGICLGMQLMCRGSEEGERPGLAWMDADVTRLDRGNDPKLKFPHMGWNVTTPVKENPLIASDEGEQRFYYVHNFRIVCDHEEDELATAVHGAPFTSAFSRDNLFGVQFHPEKSHRFGMALMRRFLALPC